MSHSKDILWKGLLEWILADLLRFVFPDADQLFDWSNPPVFMDKELAALAPGSDEKITVRVVDKLVKMQLKKERPVAMLHIEVQAQTETQERRLFSARMYQYYNLIFAKYARPTAAIAIYTGADGHSFPKSYRSSLMNSRLQYNYDTVTIREYSDETLAASDNPFAWAMLIAKQALLRGKYKELRLLEKKWLVFKMLYRNGLFHDRKLQALLVFMKDYVPFEDPEISRIFEERCDSLTGKTNTMDIFEQVAQMRLEEAEEKGRQEGLQEGERIAKEKAIHQLLSHTEFSDEKIAALVGATVNQVAAIRDQMRTK